MGMAAALASSTTSSSSMVAMIKMCCAGRSLNDKAGFLLGQHTQNALL